MHRITRRLDASPGEIWPVLQTLPAWEGIGGLTDLRLGVHDDQGDLRQFAFTIETPLGRVRDTARVTPLGARGMRVRADAKGVEVTVELRLETDDGSTVADFGIGARGATLVTRPLAATLQTVLASNIDKEARRMVERVMSLR